MDVMDIAEGNFASTHPELHYYCDFGGTDGHFHESDDLGDQLSTAEMIRKKLRC